MEELVLKYGIICLSSIILLYLLFKRFIYSILDPLAQVLLMLASMVALSFDHRLVWYIILCIFAFWLGLYVVFPKKKIQITNSISIENVETLKVYTFFLYIVYLFSMLYVFSQSGIALFADNPTTAKLSVFEGMGILRRVSFIGNIIPINLLLLYLVTPQKKKYLLFLLLFCVLKILQGSKSSILGVILVVYYLFFKSPLQQLLHIGAKRKNLLIASFISVSLIILVYIIAKEAQNESSGFIYSFTFRLMEFGDIMLYYKEDNVRSVFEGYDIFTYIGDELNGILGMLRICPYEYPLGYKMISEFRGYESDVITGPNGVYIIKGHIYFGYVGGIIYSFICGYVLALFRRLFFTMQIRDIFWYSFLVFVFFSIGGFLRESGQFYSTLFDWAFYTFPFLFISQLMIKKYGRYKE